ncbi:DUF6883 domain-containing protein [Micromonospora sp. WMMD736]|uniref:DUF6883 domain-containing protein n=1 Tax=Micromonospora sp. WMMD736 TaxID=3404112 RepID=UPI003B9490B0
MHRQSPGSQRPDSPGPTKLPGDPSRPDFSKAEIDSRKITAYAMNPEHPVGKNKYRVINSATGLGPDDADVIIQQIREGILASKPLPGKADDFGQRWSVDLPLTGPDGTITVRTAWILENGASAPRMVTISFPPKEG